MLDQDSFRLARDLGLRDDVVPVQAGAGCAGLARAAAIAARLSAAHVLVVTYNTPSRVTGDLRGGISPLYRRNSAHPLGRSLWASAGIFSDGAAALVLSRQPDPGGLVLYSRDSLRFGDEPGFADPLIHYPGGGAHHPAGTPGAAELSCYGMNGPAVKRYYTQGMMLNHAALDAALPGYVSRVRRIYTHQASPALVAEFGRLAGLPPGKAPTNARQFGNLVSASTAKMLHDDLLRGDVRYGDVICTSVVGAGPERGAYVVPVRIAAAGPSSAPGHLIQEIVEDLQIGVDISGLVAEAGVRPGGRNRVPHAAVGEIDPPGIGE
jgi:3-oxoacyl-[acyl-carrier-protein] synthase III